MALAIFQIQKVIATITLSVSSYYIKIKSLWDELDTYRSFLPCNKMKAYNGKMKEDYLMQILMGLNDAYKGVRSNILVMSPLSNIRQAYSLIIPDETQQKLSMINLGNHDVYANAAGFLMNFNTLVNFVFTKPWILDSGAIDHIVSNPKLFINSTPSSVFLVNLPTSSIAPIMSKGSSNLIRISN